MPAPVSLEQLVILEQAIAKFPDGATVEQIAGAMVPPPAERTLSRWLTILVQRRRVERIGHTRAIRYRALHPPGTETARPAAIPAAPEAIAAPRELRSSAGVSACPPTPGADLTEQIFAAAIGDIVRFKMSRAAAVMVLQRMTELNIASVDDRRACLTVLNARLNAFTEAEAERYGLEPEQYHAWCAHDGAVRGGRDVRVPEAGSGDPAKDAADSVVRAPRPQESGPERTETNEEGPGTEVGRDRWARRVEDAAVPSEERHQPRPTSYRAAGDISHIQRPTSKERSLSAAGTEGAEVARDRWARRVEGTSAANSGSSGPDLPQGGDASAGFQQTAADMKRLITPGRVAVSALWAGGVSTAATHLVGGPAAQAVTFLMAGVPPLLFVDRDRVAANNPMDLRAKLTTLVAGGSGSMLCAAPVSYVLESAVGIFR